MPDIRFVRGYEGFPSRAQGGAGYQKALVWVTDRSPYIVKPYGDNAGSHSLYAAPDGIEPDEWLALSPDQREQALAVMGDLTLAVEDEVCRIGEFLARLPEDDPRAEACLRHHDTMTDWLGMWRELPGQLNAMEQP